MLELGLGMANDSPDDMNFTYRGKLSPYVRVGANYNFMFKRAPRYQLLVGARLGFSTFGYDITDVTVGSVDFLRDTALLRIYYNDKTEPADNHVSNVIKVKRDEWQETP